MQQTRVSRALKILLHVIFFFSGIATILIGPILPVLAKHFALNDLQVSFFFPSQFAGSLCGSFLTSRFARRNKLLLATILGGISMGSGLLLMNVDSLAICLIGFFMNGLGIGLTLPSINMLILEINPGRLASAMSILNFCWGLGAIICKPFVDAFSSSESIGLTTTILAVPLIALALLIAFTSKHLKPAPKHDDALPEAANVPIWTMPFAWAIALFNFVHVGFESGMGGWITTYTGRIEGGSVVNWLSPTLLFFTFFVLGRGVAPMLFRFLNENKMLLLGLSVVLLGMILTLSAGTIITLSIGSAVAGFGTSWIFPTNIARFSKTFGPTATRRATPLFVCGTLGAAVSTWLIGFISNQTGSLHSGMYVLIISVILLIALQIALSLRRTEPIS